MAESKRVIDLIPEALRAQLFMEMVAEAYGAPQIIPGQGSRDTGKEKEPEKATEAEIDSIVDKILPK